MFKMIRPKIILAVVLLLVGGGALYSLRVFSNSKSNNQGLPIQTVLVGTDESKETFGESVKSAKVFYDLYGRALSEIKAENYDTAIELLNESLPHVEFGPEKAMVYYELAKIYKVQTNLDMELKYAELVPKYTANPDVKKEFEQRAAEIRQLLATKS